jgi:dGTP triphosphohydrolase
MIESFFSAFRSLQDKTQVIPLSKTDFVHTRLTHSLEVSVVGVLWVVWLEKIIENTRI